MESLKQSMIILDIYPHSVLAENILLAYVKSFIHTYIR